ncbi:hypothetical protein [Sphingomonas immobilis]|uniref:Uncharacterized protein n=1 Tax=Sphingomonas immobilis TaxID=3063997 RepID=A0ABT8ZWH9_9SPHN|nr:hypothetical protein [Sphingomonas sp. CA1-15]MDO7841916.1 hypothetical protein [Sphingomonas sp. CA1-15]
MEFEGRFWLLWEDEPLSLTSTRFFDFSHGEIVEARTGERCGIYRVTEEGVDATFDEHQGVREVVKLRMPHQHQVHDIGVSRSKPPFDPAADAYDLTFSNVGYETYAATRPANDHESDDEEDARRDWEVEQFGIVPMFGYGYRDCEEARDIGEANAREYTTRRRAALTIV